MRAGTIRARTEVGKAVTERGDTVLDHPWIDTLDKLEEFFENGIAQKKGSRNQRSGQTLAVGSHAEARSTGIS